MEENTEDAYLAILKSCVFVRAILRQVVLLDGRDALEDQTVLIKYGLDECPDGVVYQAKIGL